LSGDKMWAILGEIGHKVTAYEDRLQKKIALSGTEYRGLLCLGEKEKITCQEFSKRMRLSLSRGSRVVDRLHNKEYVERVDCPTDRRCKNIWLTKKGVRLRQKIEREIQKWESAIEADFSQREVLQLRSALKKVADKL
jgi:DNA-binding MarR family transcriptional regulator